ncbi:hypothetical protein HDU67_008838 [Dinochytrium kinnereticum]|nr:hypothetical protein HDU67_008838 [Dinochytrium kinnereticum]
MPASSTTALASTMLSTALGATATGLAMTMLLMPWFNVNGPEIKGFVLLRERGIFVECTTTNLNTTTLFPISKEANRTCASTGGTPCADYTDKAQQDACYNQTKGGYLSVGATVFSALAIITFIATLLFVISKARKSSAKVFNVCSATGLSIAACLAALSGVCAALARYFMGLVIDYANVYAAGISARTKVTVRPADLRIAATASIVASVLALLAALMFPVSFSAWAKYFDAVEAERRGDADEEMESGSPPSYQEGSKLKEVVVEDKKVEEKKVAVEEQKEAAAVVVEEEEKKVEVAEEKKAEEVEEKKVEEVVAEEKKEVAEETKEVAEEKKAEKEEEKKADA